MNLVALSGGYDSTAMLVKLLTAGEACCVHHVHLTNSWHNEAVEREACRRIVEHLWLRHEFVFSASRIEYVVPGWMGQDNLQALVMVLSEAERLLCRDNGLELKICFGFNRDDSTFPALAPRMRGIFDGFWSHLGPGVRRPELCYPLLGMSKAELLAFIPAELLGVCITCPRPVEGKPCGKCLKCGILAGALDKRRLAA